MIDELIRQAIFATDEKVRKDARLKIREMAEKQGIRPASIHELYMAFGKNKLSGFTIPAFNLRALTYDVARQIFRIAKQKKIGAFIFEIARSEMTYTFQKPEEYATSILAAAIKENYQGPVFIQGDHYQFKAKIFQENPQTEIENIKKLIKESIEAGFYNIDIDASTLVDLNKPSLADQQKNNYEMTALMTEYIRSIEPKNITVSVGGEIGHIGGKNSTPEEFEAFMSGYLKKIEGQKIAGISKVSVQTGTSHGGIPLADGTIAKVSLDFTVLQSVSEIARKKYGVGGSVQHGASTLPNDLFNRFPENQTLEIHLATGFQNIIYENLPNDLREEIYDWIKKNLKDEKKDGQSEEQFIYKTRKKALGPFKEKLWSLSDNEKKPICDQLTKQFEYLFDKLNTFNTKQKTDQFL